MTSWDRYGWRANPGRARHGIETRTGAGLPRPLGQSLAACRPVGVGYGSDLLGQQVARSAEEDTPWDGHV